MSQVFGTRLEASPQSEKLLLPEAPGPGVPSSGSGQVEGQVSGQGCRVNRANLLPGALPAWSHLLKAWATATSDSLHSAWGKEDWDSPPSQHRLELAPGAPCCSLGHLTANEGGM